MEHITMQFRDLTQGYRAVAFNAPLEYFATHITLTPQGVKQILAEMTVKDCRHIDGTVYFAKGRVPDNKMCELIGFYNNVKDNGKWKQLGKDSQINNSIKP